jgi:hypothetical protein
MNGISLINSKAARTIIYIFFVGGLLNLSAGALWFLWNYGLTGLIEIGEVSFLESVGLISFIYVFYFGYKFGEKKDAEAAAAKCNLAEQMNNSHSIHVVRQMSQQDKNELKNAIARCCGLDDATNRNSVQSSPRPENFNPYSPLKQKKKI